MQISCEFGNDFLRNDVIIVRLSHLRNPANCRAASDEKPTPALKDYCDELSLIYRDSYSDYHDIHVYMYMLLQRENYY